MDFSIHTAYTIPDGVQAARAGGRPALTTPEGGKIVVDWPMLALWQAATGKNAGDILEWATAHGWNRLEAACSLACLRQAGLLHQPEPATAQPNTAEPAQPPVDDAELVSAVIVSYNSRSWLPGCLATLRAQTYRPVEIIVVDNGSADESADWLAANHPEVRLLRRPEGGSLAAALNAGVRLARGSYLLLLNPDVELEADATAQMVHVAGGNERCAAVAAKLRFLWAPAFLNGLGNFVGAFSYGADSALGHLDLGQFDDWQQLPSACFAAALIPAAAFEAVGPIDEGFPMYYEDTEWCYRARLLGWQVRAAPLARVYHAFSGRTPSGEESGLAAAKLRRVVYGRLRFITRLLSKAWLERFRRRYRLEDLVGWLLAAARRDPRRAQAYRLAWQDYRHSLSSLLNERAGLQARRACPDAQLFARQRAAPLALIWRGLPLLTRDVILQHYAPWLTGPGRERFPEIDWALQSAAGKARLPRRSHLQRALAIGRAEGLAALLHRVGRAIQWRWMQP